MKRWIFFCAQDKHRDTCPKSFQLQNDVNFTGGLHFKIWIKTNMLIELCVGNYVMHDGFVNGVDGIFQALIKLPNS